MPSFEESLARMKDLYTYGREVNESNNLKTHTLEHRAVAADGVTYGIIRENSKYYIKSAPKGKETIAEAYDYLGGFCNKGNYEYNSYAKALKQFELKMASINEACDQKVNIESLNPFRSHKVLQEATDAMRDEIARQRQIMYNAAMIMNESCEIGADRKDDVVKYDGENPEAKTGKKGDEGAKEAKANPTYAGSKTKGVKKSVGPFDQKATPSKDQLKEDAGDIGDAPLHPNTRNWGTDGIGKGREPGQIGWDMEDQTKVNEEEDWASKGLPSSAGVGEADTDHNNDPFNKSLTEHEDDRFRNKTGNTFEAKEEVGDDVESDDDVDSDVEDVDIDGEDSESSDDDMATDTDFDAGVEDIDGADDEAEPVDDTDVDDIDLDDTDMDDAGVDDTDIDDTDIDGEESNDDIMSQIEELQAQIDALKAQIEGGEEASDDTDIVGSEPDFDGEDSFDDELDSVDDDEFDDEEGSFEITSDDDAEGDDDFDSEEDFDTEGDFDDEEDFDTEDETDTDELGDDDELDECGENGVPQAPADPMMAESKRAVMNRIVESVVKKMINEDELHVFGKHPGYRKKPMELPSTGEDKNQWGEDWNDESVYSEEPFGSKIGNGDPFNNLVDAVTKDVMYQLKAGVPIEGENKKKD